MSKSSPISTGDIHFVTAIIKQYILGENNTYLGTQSDISTVGGILTLEMFLFNFICSKSDFLNYRGLMAESINDVRVVVTSTTSML